MKVNNGGGRTATKENHTNAYLRLQSLSAFKTVSIRKDFKMTRIIIGIRYIIFRTHAPFSWKIQTYSIYMSVCLSINWPRTPLPPRKIFKLYLGLEPQPHSRKKKSGCLHEWSTFSTTTSGVLSPCTRGRVRISKVHSSDLLLNVRIHPHPLHCNNLSYKTAVSYQICSYLVSIRSSCMYTYFLLY